MKAKGEIKNMFSRFLKVSVKVILALVVVIVLGISIFMGWLIYETDYHIVTYDMQTSPNGQYTLTLQQIGEPFFDTAKEVRMTLKANMKVIDTYTIGVKEDVNEELWTVIWKDEYAEVAIDGVEDPVIFWYPE